MLGTLCMLADLIPSTTLELLIVLIAQLTDVAVVTQMKPAQSHMTGRWQKSKTWPEAHAMST